MNCCKILAIALFGWLAVHIALIPFESGTFTPSNPDLDMNRNVTSLLDLDTSKQRIVLIVGNSEILQRNILDWIRSTPRVLPTWAYPIPTREDLEQLHFIAPPRHKSFDPFFATLRGDASYYKSDSKHKMKPSDVDSLINLYKDKAATPWNAGKNLVVASSQGGRLDAAAIDKWIQTLPEGASVEDVQVIITYQSPRHLQVIQAWQAAQQETKKGAKNTTLTQFLGEGQLQHHFDDMNPLGTAEVFVKKGMQTIIIDEKGLLRERVDVSTAVGCLVLKVRCKANGIAGEYRKESVSSSIGDSMDLTDSKLKQIEKVLQDFDCGLYDTLSKPSNVHFLYREALFQSCSSLSRQITAKDAVRKIEDIARSP